ncbi:MAG: hypothetical protein R3E66_23385 [bacterium]
MKSSILLLLLGFAACSSTEPIEPQSWPVSEEVPAVELTDSGDSDVADDPLYFSVDEHFDNCLPHFPRSCPPTPPVFSKKIVNLNFAGMLNAQYNYEFYPTDKRILVTVAFPDSPDPRPRKFEWFGQKFIYQNPWPGESFRHSDDVTFYGTPNENGVPDWMGDESALRSVFVRFEDLDTGRWAEKTCVDVKYRGGAQFEGETYTFWSLRCAPEEAHDRVETPD